MSKFIIEQVIDSNVECKISDSGKNTNLNAIRVRFIKYGDPSGTMKLQVLNEAKTSVLAESGNLKTQYTDETDYEGTDDNTNMSWIKFTFSGEAMRTGNVYFARLVPDSTYLSNVEVEEYLNTWTEDGGYYKATPTGTPTVLFKNDTKMTSVGSKPAIDSATKYYWDGSELWVNFNPVPSYLMYMYTATTNWIATVLDYPKPTNVGNTTTFETTNGRNFAKYPRMTLQVFGRDYG